MKSLLVLIALATMSSAADPIKLTRTYKEGDKSIYKMHMTELLESADADVDATFNETVKKVDDSGTTELDVSITEFKIMAGGMDIPAPGPEPRTIKLDKTGIPFGGVEESSVTRLVPDLYVGFAYGKDLTPGHDVPVDFTDTGETKTKTTGTINLESVTSGIAKVTEKLKMAYPGDEPALHVDLTAYIDVATGKLDHMEGKLTNIPTKLAGRYMVQSAEFKVTRG